MSHVFIESDDKLLYCIDVAAARTRSKVRTQMRLCIPQVMRNKILSQVHGGVFAMHSGIIHTYDKLRENVWWPSMLKDVNVYISACSVCQVNKSRLVSVPVQPMSVPSGPCEIVCIDITGPFPITDKNYIYILVVIDRYTRYVEAWPMTDQTTMTVTMTFISGYVCRHGIPLV